MERDIMMTLALIALLLGFVMYKFDEYTNSPDRNSTSTKKVRIESSFSSSEYCLTKSEKTNFLGTVSKSRGCSSIETPEPCSFEWKVYSYAGEVVSGLAEYAYESLFTAADYVTQGVDLTWGYVQSGGEIVADGLMSLVSMQVGFLQMVAGWPGILWNGAFDWTKQALSSLKSGVDSVFKVLKDIFQRNK